MTMRLQRKFIPILYAVKHTYKKISYEQGLTPEVIAEIMSEEKANQREMFKVPMERIRKYIPKGNAKQTEDFVLKACEHYYKVLQRKKERSL